MPENAELLRVVNNEIVACRKCPRLVGYRENVAREKRLADRAWAYLGKAGSGIWRPARAITHRRIGARRARLQSHRANVHRRSLGDIFVPVAVRCGLRQPA